MIDLAAVLQEAGVSVIRESGDEILGVCPMHFARTGKVDRNPSWSINSKTFVHHCFSCGYSGTLNGLLHDLDFTNLGDLEWEISKVSAIHKVAQTSTTQTTEHQFDGGAINEWVLENKFVDVPERMRTRRHLTKEALDAFGVRWDPERKCWVLPIRSSEGELLGYQFRQKGSVINWPPSMEKSRCLFGFDVVDGAKTVALVESPLDAVRLYGLGIPAVSSFGAWVSSEQIRLLSNNFSYVVVALDNDKAGWDSRDKITPVLKDRGVVALQWDYSGLDAKDPGDVEDDEQLIEAWNRSRSIRWLIRVTS